jgi:16S rRNA C1402 N4-methylase RsmH
MDNVKLKELIAQHGTLKTVSLESSEGKLVKVFFKQPSDDVMELAYSKDNIFTRGKSLYVNCKVASDNDELLNQDVALRQKAYVAALMLDDAGKGVGELQTLSVASVG